MSMLTINAKVLVPLDVTVDVNKQDEINTKCPSSWYESVRTIIKYKAIEMISNGNIDTSHSDMTMCDCDSLIE